MAACRLVKRGWRCWSRVGHAFLAHIGCCAKLGDLLGGGLQFAFQALGAMLHGPGGGDQPIHQLAHIGWAALAANSLAADNIACSRGVAPGFPACPVRLRSAPRYCRPAIPSPAPRGRGRQRKRRSEISARILSGFDEGCHHLGDAGFHPRVGIEQFEIVRRRATPTSSISASAVLAKSRSRPWLNTKLSPSGYNRLV